MTKTAKKPDTSLSAQVRTLRALLIEATSARTKKWADEEGLTPKPFTPESARELRISELVDQLAAQVSSGGVPAFRELMDLLYGKPIPRNSSKVSKWGSLVAVASMNDASGARTGYVAIHCQGGARGVLSDPILVTKTSFNTLKAHIRPATDAEISALVGALPDGTVLELAMELA